MFSPRSLIPGALAALLLVSACGTPEVPSTESNPTEAVTSAATDTTDAPSTDETAAAAPAECVAPGDASDTVAIGGDFGGEVSLTADLPIEAAELQRTVLIEGEGEPLAQGTEVNVGLHIFHGNTGELLESYEGASMTIDQQMLVHWAYSGINCSTMGERSVLVGPAEDALEGNLEGSGFEEGETVVFVFDIKGTPPGTLDEADILAKAEGEPQAAPAGFPTVELDEDGAPTITIPETEAPTELSVATLIKGDGEEVQAGDRVYVHYRGVIWNTGEEFDSSWSRGSHTAFITTEVIGGFSEALVGQTVGSQVISVVPAASEQGGYGPDALVSMGYESDDVMVFVLDILGTASTN